MADMIKDAMAEAHNHLKVAHENLINAQTWLDILSAGHNPEPRSLPKTQVFGLTSIWTCLALFIGLIVLAQFLRRRNFSVTSGSKCQHKMDNCLRSAYENLRKISSIICKTSDAMQSSPTLITHVDRTSEGSVLQHQTELKPDPTNNETTSVGAVPQPPSELIKSNVINKENMTTEIKNSIKKLLSSKESLKLTKLDKINENEVEDIKDAIKAVRSIEEYLTLLKSQKDNYGEHEKKIQDALKPAIDVVQSLEKIINNGF